MIDNIVQSFLKKRYELNMGAGKLSNSYKTSKETIYKAKVKAREIINKKTGLPKILIMKQLLLKDMYGDYGKKM